MNSQYNKLEQLKTFDLVGRALNLDLFAASDFLAREGYIKRDENNPDKFLCTYHEEKTPSFNRDRRFKNMRCFGCGMAVKPLQIYADYLIKEKLTGRFLYLPKKEQTLEKNLLRWEAAIFLCYNLGEISEAEKDYQMNQLALGRSNRMCIDLEWLETDQDIIAEKGEGDGSYFISRKSSKGENSFEIAKLKIDEFENINIGSREELHIVYTLFRDAVEMTRGYRLIDKHKKHLLYERKLSEHEIRVNGYFSHPSESEKPRVMSNLINLLVQNKIDPMVLKRIPGFKFNQYTNSFEIGTQYYDAFFIPLLDLFGNTHREQLRTNGKTKYLWYVVSKAGNCKTPTSTLFPLNRNYMDLVRGNMIPSHNMQECFNRYFNSKGMINNTKWEDEVVIIISEGHFKSYELAKYFNTICISIQGLNTWDCSVIALIKIQQMLQMYKKRITKVIIAFDSDTRVKKGLFDNGADLSKLLRNETISKTSPDDIRFLENIECFYLEWNDKLGKGFDDVLHNGYGNEVFSITKDTDYEYKHRVVVSLISKQIRELPHSLTTNDLTKYYDLFAQLDIRELEIRLKRAELIDNIIHASLGANIHTVDGSVICNMERELNIKSTEELEYIKNSMNISC